MACLFGHKWNGCKCERCGKTRDEGHKYFWASQGTKCMEVCDICGKVIQHEHDYEQISGKCIKKCRNCGTTLGTEHDYQTIPGKCYDICSICGNENRKYDKDRHKWVRKDGECAEYCSVCGDLRLINHDYVKVPGECCLVCSVCGRKDWKKNHTWQDVEGKCLQQCTVCGETQHIEHSWKNGRCTVCGEDINKPDIHGNIPLIWHSLEGHVDTVKSLIAGGANVNISSDETALMAAARKGYDEAHLEIMRLLIGAGANVNATDMYGSSALRLAQRKGCNKAVQLLQQYGGKYLGV